MALSFSGYLAFIIPPGVLTQGPPSAEPVYAPWSGLDSIANVEPSGSESVIQNNASPNNAKYGFCAGVGPSSLGYPPSSAKIIFPLRIQDALAAVTTFKEAIYWVDGEVFQLTNLTGSPSDVSHDAATEPDTTWLLATEAGATQLNIGLGDPTAKLLIGDNSDFRIRLRKNAGGGNNPGYRIELWQNGSEVFNTINSVFDGTGDNFININWGHSSLVDPEDGSGLELRIIQTSGEGGGADARFIEVGSVEFIAELERPTIAVSSLPSNTQVSALRLYIRAGAHPTNWSLRFSELGHNFDPIGDAWVAQNDDDVPALSGDLDNPPWGTGFGNNGDAYFADFKGAGTVDIGTFFGFSPQVSFTVAFDPDGGSPAPSESPVIRVNHATATLLWTAQVDGDFTAAVGNLAITASGELEVTKPLAASPFLNVDAEADPILMDGALVANVPVNLQGISDLSLQGGPIDTSGLGLISFEASGAIEKYDNMDALATVQFSTQATMQPRFSLSAALNIPLSVQGQIDTWGGMSVGGDDAQISFSVSGGLLNNGYMAGSLPIVLTSAPILGGDQQIAAQPAIALSVAAGLEATRDLSFDVPVTLAASASTIMKNVSLAGTIPLVVGADGAALTFDREDRAPEERWIPVPPRDRQIPVQPKDRVIAITSQQRNS